MRFEKELKEYKTTNCIVKASEYLEDAIERLIPKLEKMTGLEVYHEKSKVSFFSNYLDFNNEECETIFKIRISDHTNNELHDEDADIRINGKLWREIKKELLEKVEKLSK